jgi:predicted phosphodiesterase
MRVAALYDVHGNLPALEAVLADPRCTSADVIVCGGDLCAGPMPVEVLDVLRRKAAERNVVRSWPTTVTLDIDGLGPTVFCHGSPRADDEILTRITPDDDIDDACGGNAIVVGGHTHVQFDRVAGRTRFVNAGSVGMPYEGRTAAFWALLGPDIELVSTAYDVESAVTAIRATGYPDAGDMAETLLAPHSAQEASTHFESLRGS